ncbi:hypothetical protein GCM10023177_47720 [Streptomyces violaceoruber]
MSKKYLNLKNAPEDTTNGKPASQSSQNNQDRQRQGIKKGSEDESKRHPPGRENPSGRIPETPLARAGFLKQGTEHRSLRVHPTRIARNMTSDPAIRFDSQTGYASRPRSAIVTNIAGKDNKVVENLNISWLGGLCQRLSETVKRV